MTFSIFRRFVCCLFLYFFYFNAQAWNQLGHMVIANIAYQQLNPITKEKIDYFVAQFNQIYPNMKTFMDMAYWPDTLKGQKIQLFTHWHYINCPLTIDNTIPKQTLDTDNAIWALTQLQPIIKNPDINSHDNSRFLAFFIHIVADLHQPLHTVSLYSQQHLNGDKGGNLYPVWQNDELTNLHRVWDVGLGIFEKPYSKQHANEIANSLIFKYPPHFFGSKLYILKAAEWINEGKTVAKQYVYDTQENEPLSSAYEKKGREIVEQTAVLAGYRLAIILNELFSQEQNKKILNKRIIINNRS